MGRIADIAVFGLNDGLGSASAEHRRQFQSHVTPATCVTIALLNTCLIIALCVIITQRDMDRNIGRRWHGMFWFFQRTPIFFNRNVDAVDKILLHADIPDNKMAVANDKFQRTTIQNRRNSFPHARAGNGKANNLKPALGRNVAIRNRCQQGG